MLQFSTIASPNTMVVFRAVTAGRNLAAGAHFILSGTAKFPAKDVEKDKIHGHWFGLYPRLGIESSEANKLCA